MNKLYLIKNPELFQGQKKLKQDQFYFEGWYFKHSSDDMDISFIPGINVEKENRSAFIQVITNDTSYFIDYSIDDFSYSDEPFFIQIKDNYFSKEKTCIHLDDKEQNIHLHGEITYSNGKEIKKSLVNPNIMGPFSYIPFMECNHAILAMENELEGTLYLNEKPICLDGGKGYIEKDWGTSFPKSYLWCQGNCFQKSIANFMCSIADIDFKLFHFRGLICVFIFDGKEYKFTTYNGSKVIKYEVLDDSFSITLKKGSYTINIRSNYGNGLKLVAPVNGKMEKDILESISEKISITLKKGNEVLFNDTSKHCGLEIV